MHFSRFTLLNSGLHHDNNSKFNSPLVRLHHVKQGTKVRRIQNPFVKNFQWRNYRVRERKKDLKSYHNDRSWKVFNKKLHVSAPYQSQSEKWAAYQSFTSILRRISFCKIHKNFRWSLHCHIEKMNSCCVERNDNTRKTDLFLLKKIHE